MNAIAPVRRMTKRFARTAEAVEHLLAYKFEIECVVVLLPRHKGNPQKCAATLRDLSAGLLGWTKQRWLKRPNRRTAKLVGFDLSKRLPKINTGDIAL
jgi:hypothetical protein